MKKCLPLIIFLLVYSTLFAQIDHKQNHTFFVPYIDNTGRDVCLTWENQTGKSVFYAWSSNINNWQAYNINLPQNPVPQSKGPIMMHPYVDKIGRDVCLTWDTQTGKSVFYSWSSEIKNWKAYTINLPENPVPDSKGPIMMRPYVDNTGRDVCLTWDTQTGNSVFYNWNTEIKNWKAYSINLPQNPIPDSKGTIMMSPYVDKSGRDVCLTWDTKTGKSVFYTWTSGVNNWKAYSINLPTNPVPNSKGSIMMEPYIDNSGRDVCLTWDTQTGKSIFYVWSPKVNNWQAYNINLPENPTQK